MSFDLMYSEDVYTNKCRHCGWEDRFIREKEITEREILRVGDGFVDIDDSDLHPQTDWVYSCEGCGRTAEDLEDLLEEISDE